MCAESVLPHWICAWSPRAGSTPTTSTGCIVWDCAAGSLIAAEAGARVVLPTPGDPGSNAALVVAAAPGIADQLLAALGRFDGLTPIPG